MDAKRERRLELRMYFFVPYNISPIQQAIQAGHSALEYVHQHPHSTELKEFLEYFKTWIILNGGTTNSALDPEGNPLGTLNQIHEDLWTNKVEHALFYEPDLNNAMTAICFICDERVWNREDYPDLTDYIYNKIPEDIREGYSTNVKIRLMSLEEIQKTYFDDWYEWTMMMGGEKNIFLRELIKGKKLA